MYAHCSKDFTITPWLWNSFMNDLISLGEFSVAATLRKQLLYQLHNSFSVPPITAGWPEAMWITKLAQGLTHGQHQESNP